MILYLFFALFVLDCFLVEFELFGFTTLCLILTGIALHYFNVFNVLQFVRNNYLHTILFVAGYVLVGLIWSFIKWVSFLLEFKRIVEDLKQRNPDRLHCNLETLLSKHENSFKIRQKFGKDKPKASNNKGRIIGWMSFWPMSLVSTLLNDPIRRLFLFIFNSFSGLYQKLADKILQNV